MLTGPVITRQPATTVVVGPRASGDTTGTLDTAAIQAALNALTTGQTLQLRAGPTYYAKQAGTQAFASAGGGSLAYCIEIPSGVTLDLNGATIKLASGNAATVLCNANPNAGTDTNIGLIGRGTVDGNGILLGSQALIEFDTVTGLTLDVRAYNTSCTGIMLSGCSNVDARYLEADTVAGTGLYLGSPSYPVTNSTFGTLIGRNCTAWPTNTFNFPGNPYYGVTNNCSIKSIYGYNCEAGVKIDRPTQDLQVGLIFGDTLGTIANPNSGVKLQGDGTGYPLRVNIGSVNMRNCTGQGLMMELTVDCSIDSYVGDNNGTVGTVPDVWISGTRDSVGSIHSSNADSSGVTIRTTATDYHLGRVTIYNANAGSHAATPAFNVPGGDGHVESLTTLDDRGSPRVTYGLGVTSATAKIRIGYFKATGWVTAAYSFAAGGLVGPRDLVSGTTTRAEVCLLSEMKAIGHCAMLATGRYIAGPGTTFSARLAPQGLCEATPLFIGNYGAIDRIGIETTVAGEAGSKIRLGVYADTGYGMPGALLLDAGTVSADAAPGFLEKTVSLTLSPGLYWLVAVAQLCPTTAPTVRDQTGFLAVMSDTTALNVSNPSGRNGYAYGGVTGALDATFAGTSTQGTCLRPLVRAA